MVKEMDIKVYLEGKLVFEGHLFDFIKANKDNEDYLLQVCESLNHFNAIQFEESKGMWKIVKVSKGAV